MGHAGEPFFAGEVEPCINGKAVTIGAYFGEDVRSIVDRLLGEQMRDAGWNCEAAAAGAPSSKSRTTSGRSAVDTGARSG